MAPAEDLKNELNVTKGLHILHLTKYCSVGDLAGGEGDEPKVCGEAISTFD